MMYMFAHVHDDQYAICVECNWCFKNYFCGMYMIISVFRHLPTWMLICACVTMKFKGVGTCSYDVYPCTHSWWSICNLRRVQLMCKKIFLWHVYDHKSMSTFAYLNVNMCMRYNNIWRRRYMLIWCVSLHTFMMINMHSA